jgi:hypothetical protein
MPAQDAVLVLPRNTNKNKIEYNMRAGGTGGSRPTRLVPGHLHNMWPPPNIHALPSKEEIQQIKEEISSMELQIIGAQLKIAALQKSVAERKAWIAPIRKVPHDVLSQIFVEVSMDDWKAPVTLQSVSRWWHDVVEGSPRVWTFIPLSYCDISGQSELVSLFVERSRNTTLHISAEHYFLPHIQILAHRIECLVLYMTSDEMMDFDPGEYDFTRLERLELRASWRLDTTPMFEVSKWDIMHFPNLKFLRLFVWDSLLVTIAASPRFPLVRHLKVVCEDPSPLTDILVKCANSLESMEFEYYGLSTPPDTTPTIHLPFLKYICLEDNTRDGRSHWYLNGSTPNLEAYVDEGHWPTTNTFKLDLRNVTYVEVSKAPDLSRFPRLTNLFIFEGHEELTQIINSLRQRPQCSLIEYSAISNERLEEANAALSAHAEETGRRVKLELIDWEKHAGRLAHWKCMPVRLLSNGPRPVKSCCCSVRNICRANSRIDKQPLNLNKLSSPIEIS